MAAHVETAKAQAGLVAQREDGRENLLDIGAEAHAINRSVDDAGRGEPVATQRRQEGEGSPRPKGALATRRWPLAQRP